tara:strand:+ start:81 stop:296 length:216 start_codon:yes stop_codon:yes gene_type:complete
MSFRITTVAREHGEGEGHGILVYVFDKCLDIGYSSMSSSWHVGHVVDSYGSLAMLKLGRFWIEYISGYVTD